MVDDEIEGRAGGKAYPALSAIQASSRGQNLVADPVTIPNLCPRLL